MATCQLPTAAAFYFSDLLNKSKLAVLRGRSGSLLVFPNADHTSVGFSINLLKTG